MVSVRQIAALLALALALPLLSRARPDEPARAEQDSLFSQSAAESLNRNFPSRDISFLLLDARNGQVLASRWERPDSPIPMGSLAKPFAALAYGEQHEFRYPVHRCRGAASGCWRPGGHGEVDVTSAIAYSCNSYFRALTADLSAHDMSETASQFGLDQPDRETTGAEFAGLGTRWRISPLRMARAYAALVHQQQHPGVAPILEGMAWSARFGTGAEVDHALHAPDALAKTGTAACLHARHAPGDGFAIALVPADEPRLLLMVRVHGVPGSQAAKTAGLMLREIED